MATDHSPGRRLVLAAAFAAAVAAAPAIAAFAAPAADGPGAPVAACPQGEQLDVFTGGCVPFLVPNSPSPFTTAPGNPDVPEIDGIPCAGRQAAQCVGLAENQPPAFQQPRSTVSSSP